MKNFSYSAGLLIDIQLFHLGIFETVFIFEKYFCWVKLSRLEILFLNFKDLFICLLACVVSDKKNLSHLSLFI